MNSAAERRAVLERSRNADQLETTLAALARSSSEEDLNLLKSFLAKADFLRRLDDSDEPWTRVKRFAAVTSELGRNHAAHAGIALRELYAAPDIAEDYERSSLILQAAAEVRPMSTDRIQLFRMVDPPVHPTANLMLLTGNASEPALAEARREILAGYPDFTDEMIVDVFHLTVVPRRTDSHVVAWGRQLAGDRLSDEIKAGIFESFFDYKYRPWYGTARVPPKPPAWDTASAQALEGLIQLAAMAQSAHLPESLHHKIDAEAAAIRQALALKTHR
jgi:hypothetical protein